MVLSSDSLLAAYTPQANVKCNSKIRHLAEQVKPQTGQDDCKVSELDRRGGRWSGLGGRRKSWLAGAWISGLETILPGAGRSDRC